MADKRRYGPKETIRLLINPMERAVLRGDSDGSIRVGPRSATAPISRRSEGGFAEVGLRVEHSMYDGLLVTDRRGAILDVNRRAGHLFACTPDRLIGENVTALIQGADSGLMDKLADTSTGEAFTLIEAYCRRRDGKDFPAEVAVSRQEAATGGRFFFFVRDITRRLQMEKDLIRLSKAVESSGDAIVILDDAGSRVYRNPAFVSLLGPGAQDEEGVRELTEFLRPAEVVAALSSAVARGETWAGEAEVLRGDGTRVPVHLRADTIATDERGGYGAVVIMTDISERKKAEHELRTALAQLARSNSELEEFAYVASHDLKEPLRAITGYLDLLVRRYGDRFDGQALEYVGHAVAGAERMREMINHVLEYARLERPASPPEEVAAGALLAQATGSLRQLISEKGARITAGPMPIIRANPARVVRVLQNLLANALKFCEHPEPRIHISAEEYPGEWIFHVADNGIGIEPELQEKVFLLFRRLHTREEYEGTGIGLATCKKVLEQAGGRIWVEHSEPGRGTIFAFALPKTPGASDSKAP